jgi:hypothetical protein
LSDDAKDGRETAMIRRFIGTLSTSALFMNVSTAFAFLAGVTSLAAFVGITLSWLGAPTGFEVRLGAELTTERLGDRIFLSVLTVFFGILSLGVLARDRHVRRPNFELEGA